MQVNWFVFVFLLGVDRLTGEFFTNEEFEMPNDIYKFVIRCFKKSTFYMLNLYFSTHKHS